MVWKAAERPEWNGRLALVIKSDFFCSLKSENYFFFAKADNWKYIWKNKNISDWSINLTKKMCGCESGWLSEDVHILHPGLD